MLPTYDIFRDLTRIDAFNLWKVIEKSSTPLPEDGEIGKLLEDDDVIEFEVTSTEIWIKIFMTMISKTHLHKAIFEVRTP